MAYKTIPASRKVQRAVHMALHLVALLVGILGVYAAFKFHREVGLSDMYSLHSWLGMGTICLFGLQVNQSQVAHLPVKSSLSNFNTVIFGAWSMHDHSNLYIKQVLQLLIAMICLAVATWVLLLLVSGGRVVGESELLAMAHFLWYGHLPLGDLHRSFRVGAEVHLVATVAWEGSSSGEFHRSSNRSLWAGCRV